MIKYVAVKTTWTDAMKDFAAETINKKLDRLIEDTSNAEFKVTNLGEKMKVDVACNSYRAQAIASDFYVAVGKAVQKLKTIATKAKHAYNKKRKYVEEKVEETVSPVSKEKTFILTPMSVEQAIKEFEETDYSFYVFRDEEENDDVSVLYKRADKTYGVIRCK